MLLDVGTVKMKIFGLLDLTLVRNVLFLNACKDFC